MAIFNSFLFVYQRVTWTNHPEIHQWLMSHLETKISEPIVYGFLMGFVIKMWSPKPSFFPNLSGLRPFFCAPKAPPLRVKLGETMVRHVVSRSVARSSGVPMAAGHRKHWCSSTLSLWIWWWNSIIAFQHVSTNYICCICCSNPTW